MANESGTYADSLELTWTGTIGDTGLYDPAASVGGVRIGEPVQHIPLISTPIGPVRFDAACIGTIEGEGTIAAVDGDTLNYTANGDTVGSSVAIAANETKVLVSGDGTSCVRVTRDSTYSAEDLGGSMTLNFREPFDGPIGGGNVTAGQASAGRNTYRAAMLHNRSSSASVTVAKVWIATLGTQATSDTTQLGASGTGTIETTGSFADWPESGWAHIRTVGATLREIVYYTSRTDTVLTISSAAHRGLLGTSAAAGAATDTVDAVPGIRIGSETPSGGAIQTISNDLVAPSGISWDTGITALTGLNIGTIAADGEVGIWVHREIPAGAVHAIEHRNPLAISWTFDGNNYSGQVSNSYRIARSTTTEYNAYIGSVDDTPDATSTTLPFSFALGPPSFFTTTYDIIVRQANEYDLESQNHYARQITLDTGGNEITSALAVPTDTAMTEVSNGEVDLVSLYQIDEDSSPADNWAIYISTDGTDPDPSTDTPTLVPMFGTMIRPARRLTRRLGPYDYGTDLRVLVRSHRSSDSAESNNETPVTLTISTTAPELPSRGRLFFGERNAAIFPADATVTDTVTFDATNNIYTVATPGSAYLYADTTLVWRVLYDSARSDLGCLYVPNTWQLINTTISGAGTDDIIETAAWNGTKTLYINVGNDGAKTRRMLIDVTGLDLEVSSFNAISTSLPPLYPAEAAVSLPGWALFNVFDAYSGNWTPYAGVNDSGEFHSKVSINQSLSQAQIEAL